MGLTDDLSELCQQNEDDMADNDEDINTILRGVCDALAESLPGIKSIVDENNRLLDSIISAYCSIPQQIGDILEDIISLTEKDDSLIDRILQIIENIPDRDDIVEMIEENHRQILELSKSIDDMRNAIEYAAGSNDKVLQEAGRPSTVYAEGVIGGVTPNEYVENLLNGLDTFESRLAEQERTIEEVLSSAEEKLSLVGDGLKTKIDDIEEKYRILNRVVARQGAKIERTATAARIVSLIDSRPTPKPTPEVQPTVPSRPSQKPIVDSRSQSKVFKIGAFKPSDNAIKPAASTRTTSRIAVKLPRKPSTSAGARVKNVSSKAVNIKRVSLPVSGAMPAPSAGKRVESVPRPSSKMVVTGSAAAAAASRDDISMDIKAVIASTRAKMKEAGITPPDAHSRDSGSDDVEGGVNSAERAKPADVRGARGQKTRIIEDKSPKVDEVEDLNNIIVVNKSGGKAKGEVKPSIGDESGHTPRIL